MVVSTGTCEDKDSASYLSVARSVPKCKQRLLGNAEDGQLFHLRRHTMLFRSSARIDGGAYILRNVYALLRRCQAPKLVSQNLLGTHKHFVAMHDPQTELGIGDPMCSPGDHDEQVCSLQMSPRDAVVRPYTHCMLVLQNGKTEICRHVE